MAHDPPFEGIEFDRFPLQESYENKFKPMELGTVYLGKGIVPIALKSTEIKGPELVDFRLLVLERIR